MTMQFKSSEQRQPEGKQKLLQGDHKGVDKIFVGFPESYTADDRWIECSINGNGKTKKLRTPSPR